MWRIQYYLESQTEELPTQIFLDSLPKYDCQLRTMTWRNFLKNDRTINSRWYFNFWSLTFGLEIFKYTIVGASDVLASCEGWLIVSQSRTTSWRVLASSNILSISACTSARHVDREFDLSMMARFEGLFRRDRFAKEMSAITRVIIILETNHQS